MMVRVWGEQTVFFSRQPGWWVPVGTGGHVRHHSACRWARVGEGGGGIQDEWVLITT